MNALLCGRRHTLGQARRIVRSRGLGSTAVGNRPAVKTCEGGLVSGKLSADPNCWTNRLNGMFWLTVHSRLAMWSSICEAAVGSASEWQKMHRLLLW
jgi:hypothetical protein